MRFNAFLLFFAYLLWAEIILLFFLSYLFIWVIPNFNHLSSIIIPRIEHASFLAATRGSGSLPTWTTTNSHRTTTNLNLTLLIKNINKINEKSKKLYWKVKNLKIKSEIRNTRNLQPSAVEKTRKHKYKQRNLKVFEIVTVRDCESQASREREKE